MISTKEDLKNVIELEKKGYGRNSLIRRYLRELRICEYYKNRGGYGNLDILKLALAILVMIRHIGQNFFRDNIFWRVYIINTISTIGVTSFFIISGFLLYKKQLLRKD